MKKFKEMVFMPHCYNKTECTINSTLASLACGVNTFASVKCFDGEIETLKGSFTRKTASYIIIGVDMLICICFAIGT